MQESQQSLGSRPSGSSSAPGAPTTLPLMPLGFSLLLSAVARESSMSLMQGAVGLAASTIVVTATVGREVLNLGLFLPAAATRLLPGWGLLFGPTPAPAAPQQPPAPALQERIRFTLTHGVEPLKAIHQHHRAKQPAQQPAVASPWVQAFPMQVPPAWASPHHHGASSTSKAAADALRARHRVAQRMQQGKALFRLPPPAATAATLVPAGNGWMISTSAHAQAAAAAPAVLSRCTSSVASKVAKVAPPPSTASSARQANHHLVQRGALASGAVSSEDEEWLPLTHLALRSSLL